MHILGHHSQENNKHFHFSRLTSFICVMPHSEDCHDAFDFCGIVLVKDVTLLPIVGIVNLKCVLRNCYLHTTIAKSEEIRLWFLRIDRNFCMHVKSFRDFSTFPTHQIQPYPIAQICIHSNCTK